MMDKYAPGFAGSVWPSMRFMMKAWTSSGKSCNSSAASSAAAAAAVAAPLWENIFSDICGLTLSAAETYFLVALLPKCL